MSEIDAVEKAKAPTLAATATFNPAAPPAAVARADRATTTSAPQGPASPDSIGPQRRPDIAAAPSPAKEQPRAPLKAMPPPPASGPAGEPSRHGRFALLAAAIVLTAATGTLLGSLGYAAIERSWTKPEPRPDVTADMRALRAEVAQLRTQMKSANDQVTQLRTAVTQSGAATNAQFAKLTEMLDRADKRAASTAAPPPPAAAEATGSLPRPQSSAPPKPIPGWIVRRVYDGTALIEGNDGILEAEVGDNVPGLGRIQEIKRDKGRWVVVTSKGMVASR